MKTTTSGGSGGSNRSDGNNRDRQTNIASGYTHSNTRGGEQSDGSSTSGSDKAKENRSLTLNAQASNSNTNTATVKFHSDGGVTSGGFRLEYSQIVGMLVVSRLQRKYLFSVQVVPLILHQQIMEQY